MVLVEKTQVYIPHRIEWVDDEDTVLVWAEEQGPCNWWIFFNDEGDGRKHPFRLGQDLSSAREMIEFLGPMAESHRRAYRADHYTIGDS